MVSDAKKCGYVIRVLIINTKGLCHTERLAELVVLLQAPTTSNRVCSKHFNPLDFVVKDDGHIWLKKNAYPFPVIITPEPFENEVEVEYTPLKYASNVVSVNLNRMYE
ncbi:hypothetical protein Bhyg_03633 [Pseudolycoriella hygida]|uniref:Uncharacterized protein n=1 Tax=Pseudolycoriella hygida TaxID=35572 RepID=A0A9Q0NDN8_9DIPT|nr:hypothetical protein Bhyg_03633 [Pseudolycoriella hygida]